MLNTLKKIIKLSPIAFSKNHLYDIQTKKIINNLSTTSNCIDVGCYEGEILDLMLNSCPKGFHFGIEPIPILYHKLAKKYKNHGSCKVFNLAVSDDKGISKFNYVVTNPSYSGLRKRDYDRPNEKEENISVQIDLLDNLIPKDIEINFIKIDVEGAEYKVLKGARRIIERYKPIVVFEHGLGASNHYDTSPSDIFNYFNSLDMQIGTLDNYLKNRDPLSAESFSTQYFEKINYYFIAYP